MEAAPAVLRPPETVMRLARMGAMHPTRLSFLRAMLRRAAREGWRVDRSIWALDEAGFGHAVYTVRMPGRACSLVAFSQFLPDEARTDRVIAEAWDTSYVLYDGVPDQTEIARLARNVPLQEAGRYAATDLILSRANKSTRLFEAVARTLAAGRQPDASQMEDVGYLLRTTAVYGNGKFGIADRERIAGRPEFAGPFQAEMLTVWLIRAFSIDLVEHRAAALSPGAARLGPALRRRFGIGNATGLGMAPFLVRHPILLHRWMLARETALARVRALPVATPERWAAFCRHVEAARRTLPHWRTADAVQAERIRDLAADLAAFSHRVAARPPAAPFPWDALYCWAETNLGLEAQEYAVSLLLEPHGALVDDLCETMSADERDGAWIAGEMNCTALARRIDSDYGWALALDFHQPDSVARFWYVSEEKLEPRLGERATEPGADREQPLAFARDVSHLRRALATVPAAMPLAVFLLEQPEFRHVVRRVQIAARFAYAEIRDNLVGAALRPIDLLRCKLAFFGAARFDPRSDRWLRICLFQDAPFPDEARAGATADAPGGDAPGADAPGIAA